MDLEEFHRCEGFHGSFYCLDGQYQWKLNSERGYDINYQPEINFTDLFGKKDDVIFPFDDPTNDEETLCMALPLTLQIVILEYMNQETGLVNWFILELEWSSGKTMIGKNKFNSEIINDSPRIGMPVVDQAPRSNTDDLYILIYKKEGIMFNCQHCKIDIKQLECQKMGEDFEIPEDRFNAISLNGDKISGLSTSIDYISQFDLKSRQILPSSLEVYGHPSTICLEIKGRTTGFILLPAVGAWTSSHLYLWSEEENKEIKKEKQNEEIYSSTLYLIDLKTGSSSQPISYKFDGRIRKLFINDEHLIIFVEKFLHRKVYIDPQGLQVLRGAEPFFEFKLYRLRIPF